MKFLQTIGNLALNRLRVKRQPRIPVAVRAISGEKRARIRKVSRPRASAVLSAWIAVETNTPEASFLRGQLAIYMQSAPREVSAPVPQTEIDGETGTLLVTYPAHDARHPSDTIFDSSPDFLDQRSPLAAESAYLRNASQAAGDAVARKLEAKESDLRMADRQLLDDDEQLERIESERNASVTAQTRAVEAGTAPLDVTVRVPSLITIIFWRLFQIGTIGSESLCTFSALANTSGVDPGNLAVEWRMNAPLISAWIVASVIVAGVLFLATEWSFNRIGTLLDEPQTPHRGLHLAIASGALLGILLTVIVIAVLRVQLLSAGSSSITMIGTYIVLGALPLIGGALASRHCRTLTAARRDALVAASVPRAADVAMRLRSAHEEALIKHRDQVRARREELVDAIQDLHASMHGSEQTTRDGARYETRVVDVYLGSLRAALSTDKKWFERFARARNRTSLLVPAEQPAAFTTAVIPLRKRRVS